MEVTQVKLSIPRQKGTNNYTHVKGLGNLKLCPFCKCSEINIDEYGIQCDRCGAEMGANDIPDEQERITEMFYRWNMRGGRKD